MNVKVTLIVEESADFLLVAHDCFDFFSVDVVRADNLKIVICFVVGIHMVDVTMAVVGGEGVHFLNYSLELSMPFQYEL